MKVVHLIDEFEALLASHIEHSSSNDVQYHTRSAICVPVSHVDSDACLDSLSISTALTCIERVLGTECPVIPDRQTTVDESDQIKQLLGQEFPVVAVDGTQDWPDNTLGAAAGTIKTPGLLVLLLPGGLVASGRATPYERHLKRVLSRHLSPHQSFDGLASLSGAHATQTFKDTPALVTENWKNRQEHIVTNLVLRCEEKEKTLDVLLAKRGRGKSATIGLAIKRLLHSADKPSSITLTASNESQVITALKHADNSLIEFSPLAHALQNQSEILFIDEAGSIPVPVLQELIANSQHTIVAGTADGYEGSGRALAIRLASAGESSSNSVSQCSHHLHHPIRWPAGDRVEAMINEVLRLDQPAHSQTQPGLHKKYVRPENVIHRQLTSDDLLNDIELLDSVFDLLLQAHYQTTSRDLKHLLNLDGLHLFVQSADKKILGACLVASEGGLSDALIRGIESGQRRPAHQRLPMLLHRQCQNPEILQQHFWRVVRIAIHPNYQHQGLGTQLLAYVFDQARQVSTEYAPSFIGASFGATPTGLKFWKRSGYKVFHWGYRLNPRSGQRAAAVGLPVTTSKANAHALQLACSHFIDSANVLIQLNEQRPLWFDVLYGPRQFDPLLLNELANPAHITSNQDKERLNHFRAGRLSLHEVWGSIARAAGGAETLAQWKFPSGCSVKQLTKHIEQRTRER